LTTDRETLRVDKARLWSMLETLGGIGRHPEGGVSRLSLTEEDLAARRQIAQWIREAGLAFRQDAAGNLIGRLEGADPAAAAVAIGSHVDTVAQGGAFDGALGVLAGIETLRAVRESGIRLRRPLEVVAFTDEEGVRFGVGYLGSRAMSGRWDGRWLDFADREGKTLREAFGQADIAPDRVAEARRRPEELRAYLELHIEQGRVLEDDGMPVGVATGIRGHVWLRVALTGSADHAGTTPMDKRKDSLLAAAEAMLAIERAALLYRGTATVGTVSVPNGATNVVPGRTTFTVDIRHEDDDTLRGFAQAVRRSIEQEARRRDVACDIEITDKEFPVHCAPSLVGLMERACADLGLPHRRLACGAGHDASAMRDIADVGLLLIRSRGGVSHHPDEWSSPEDCEAGANALLRVAMALADEPASAATRPVTE